MTYSMWLQFRSSSRKINFMKANKTCNKASLLYYDIVPPEGPRELLSRTITEVSALVGFTANPLWCKVKYKQSVLGKKLGAFTQFSLRGVNLRERRSEKSNIN